MPAENEFLGDVRKKENEQLRKSCVTGNELSTQGKELALCRGRLFFFSPSERLPSCQSLCDTVQCVYILWRILYH